jgi:GNAT superfamily N-acetyltransferase
MITKLQKDHFHKVKEMFVPLRHQLFPAAVVAGLQDGDIYVDDVLNPRSAMMITREVWAYLAGDPNHMVYNQALNQALFDKRITPMDSWGLLVSCTEDWEQALKVIFLPRELIELQRRHYRGRKQKIQTLYQVPEGYELRLIDAGLRNFGGKLPEDVVQLLDSWEGILDPKLQGFGFVAVRDGAIAGHAVVDVVVGTFGDVGLVTSEQHRLRGLGTALSAASADYGFNQRGLEELLWDCMEDNLGSIRIAEKLGFEFQENHPMYIFDFEPITN